MHGKIPKKKSINDGFMYVCVADFVFVSTVVFIDNFPQSLGKKTKNDGFLCMYVKQNPSLMDFFWFFSRAPFPKCMQWFDGTF